MFITPEKRNLGNTLVFLNHVLKLNSNTKNESSCFSNLNSYCSRNNCESEGRQTFTVWSIKEWHNPNPRPLLKNAKIFKRKLLINLNRKVVSQY